MRLHQRLVSIFGGIRKAVAAHLDEQAINAACREEKYTWRKSGVSSSFLAEIRCQFGGNPVSAEIRCQFIILARKDELTPDYACEKTN